MREWIDWPEDPNRPGEPWEGDGDPSDFEHVDARLEFSVWIQRVDSRPAWQRFEASDEPNVDLGRPALPDPDIFSVWLRPMPLVKPLNSAPWPEDIRRIAGRATQRVIGRHSGRLRSNGPAYLKPNDRPLDRKSVV